MVAKAYILAFGQCVLKRVRVIPCRKRLCSGPVKPLRYYKIQPYLNKNICTVLTWKKVKRHKMFFFYSLTNWLKIRNIFNHRTGKISA